ncbi:MAG: hypothetical protein ACO26U_08145, partial [Burkholderiaceae bacterium]
MSSRSTSLRRSGLSLLHPELRLVSDTAADVEPHRFSTAAYLGLVERGLVGPEQRIELIDGRDGACVKSRCNGAGQC